MSLGGYPPGAEHLSNAPYNLNPDLVDCPDCNGEDNDCSRCDGDGKIAIIRHSREEGDWDYID